MKLHADFAAPVTVWLDGEPWVASPAPGVERRMLDRVGGEVARATSVVRYAPGSAFPAHVHAQGEEYLVLEGVFSDERGDHRAGTYVRNPWESTHAPFTREGCTIFVKLRQMAGDDRRQVVVEPQGRRWRLAAEGGVEVAELHRHGVERVWMERHARGAEPRRIVADGVLEVLILEGAMVVEGVEHRALTWLRRPDGAEIVVSSAGGCLLWCKVTPVGL